METVYYIALGIFFTYTVVIAIIFGILPSLSDSYYALREKYGEKAGMIFQAMLIITACLMWYVLVTITYGKWYQFLSFFTTFPLILTGVAPKFRSKPPYKSLESGVHGKSAALSALASLVLVIAFSLDISTVWVSLVAGVVLGGAGYLLNGYKNQLYWAEYACFTWLFGMVDIVLKSGKL